MKCVNQLVCLYGCRDKTVVNHYLLSVLVRLFLEKQEQSILKFVADFSRLTVSDEKVNTCIFCQLVMHLVICDDTVSVTTGSIMFRDISRTAVKF